MPSDETDENQPKVDAHIARTPNARITHEKILQLRTIEHQNKPL